MYVCVRVSITVEMKKRSIGYIYSAECVVLCECDEIQLNELNDEHTKSVCLWLQMRAFAMMSSFIVFIAH